MAVESWLAPTPQYDDPIVADSPALQAAIETLLTAAGWTNTGGDRWQSPDPDHWLGITFSQPDSAKLALVGDDYQGRAYPERRVGAVGAGSQWDLYVNPFGLAISGAVDGKWFYGGVLDHFPKGVTSHVLDVIWIGALNSSDAGTTDSNSFVNGPRYDGAVGIYLAAAYPATEINGSIAVFLFVGGPRRDMPWLFWAEGVAGVRKVAGRAYHAIAVVSNLAAGAEIIGVIDEGETGTFKVSRIPAHGSFPYMKIAFLKAKS